MAVGRSDERVVGGVRVHTEEWTPSAGATRGRRVLLVHGLGASTVSWQPVAAILAEATGATVTALDLIGFGRTRAPERRATIAVNRELVTGYLDAHGPALFIGNSMGAAIGMGVTARRPDLVEGLVLVDPALPHPNPGVADWARLSRFAPVMLAPLGRRVIGTRARLLGPERLVDTTLAWCLHDPARLDPAVRHRLIALAAERFGWAEAPAAYADAARSLLLYLARDLHADLACAANLRPTLLVHGRYDRLVNVDCAHDAAARHQAIDLQVLDDIGHAPQLEAPETLTAAVTAWMDARMSGWSDPASVSSTSPFGPSSTT
jgi:pimeloyl-ACP methyl ester carboxylesterase